MRPVRTLLAMLAAIAIFSLPAAAEPPPPPGSNIAFVGARPELADPNATPEPLNSAVLYPPQDKLITSPGNTAYFVDPVAGDDANPAGKPWKSIAKVNALKLAAGDKVVIAPGLHAATLKPSGEGTREHPIVIQFLPGVHIIAVDDALRLPMFVSNSCDDPKTPKPIGILVQHANHLRFEGGGVSGPGKTTIIYGGRMVEIFNDHATDITYSGLVFDLQRPTVSEFRPLAVGAHDATIQIAEGSAYTITDGKFMWTGDWGTGGILCQEVDLQENRCWRARAPFGWDAQGQTLATATDLGNRMIKLDYGTGASGLTMGHQYQFRLIRRDSVGVHNARSKDIVIRNCDFYALTNMGLVSQFTENITYTRVNVAPPAGTIRTCAAWADIFQFSNCKGDILVEDCHLAGMQDDAINCHGTHLRIIAKTADNQLLMRFMQPQTYGFAAFGPGDEVAVIGHSTLREYDNNPRRHVVKVEKQSDQEWLLTLDGPTPAFESDDVLDNVSWNPNLTARNNDISMNPVRGFLLTTRGKVLVENNRFWRCAMPAILIGADAESWFESGPVRDMTIRRNAFLHCGISIIPRNRNADPNLPVHENIRIEDNYFDDAGISARSVRGLTIIHNRSSGNSLPVHTDGCTEVNVEGNTFGAKE